jgi:transposase
MAGMEANPHVDILSAPYSPDLNPIKLAFSKLKAGLRKVAVRTIDIL